MLSVKRIYQYYKVPWGYCGCGGGTGVCGACVHGRSGRMGRLLAWRASAPAAPPRSTTAHPPLPPCRQAYNYPTTVMAASFRNVGEIRQLAG